MAEVRRSIRSDLARLARHAGGSTFAPKVTGKLSVNGHTPKTQGAALLAALGEILGATNDVFDSQRHRED